LSRPALPGKARRLFVIIIEQDGKNVKTFLAAFDKNFCGRPPSGAPVMNTESGLAPNEPQPAHHHGISLGVVARGRDFFFAVQAEEFFADEDAPADACRRHLFAYYANRQYFPHQAPPSFNHYQACRLISPLSPEKAFYKPAARQNRAGEAAREPDSITIL